jgi:hypothetical protein
MPGAKPYEQLQYKQINGKRMAYIDEGRGDAMSSSTATRHRRTCGAT